jgi:hypothetical protein
MVLRDWPRVWAMAKLADPAARRHYGALAAARAGYFMPEWVGAALLRFMERLSTPNRAAEHH